MPPLAVSSPSAGPASTSAESLDSRHQDLDVTFFADFVRLAPDSRHLRRVRFSSQIDPNRRICGPAYSGIPASRIFPESCVDMWTLNSNQGRVTLDLHNAEAVWNYRAKRGHRHANSRGQGVSPPSRQSDSMVADGFGLAPVANDQPLPNRG